MAAREVVTSSVAGLARFGYTTKGIIWLMIGLLAAGVAFGVGGATTGADGVLRTFLGQPFGKALVAFLAAGLAAYAAWRLVEAVADPEGKGAGFLATLERLGIAINGVGYALLAVEGVQLIFGRTSGVDGRPEHWVAKVLAWPHGIWLVGAVGVGIVVVTVIQIRQALVGRIARELGLEEADPTDRDWIVRLGRVGMAFSSLVFGITGYLLLRAAITYDPAQSGGVGDVLATISHQPLSRVLLGAVAVGLIAYGGFQLVIARYRRIILPR